MIRRHSERAADRPRRWKRSDPAVELGVGKDGLDHALALAVERAGVVGGQHAAHERVRAALPARPRGLALGGVRRDEDLDAALDDRLHLHLMAVAGVGDNDLRWVGQAGVDQLVF